MDRADFERLSENGAFAPDVFASFGFYSVPELTEEERKRRSSSLMAWFPAA